MSKRKFGCSPFTTMHFSQTIITLLIKHLSHLQKHTVVFKKTSRGIFENVQCFFKNVQCFFQNNGYIK